MSKPAHKQDNPKHAPGQWVNVDLNDQTLEDYIRRKQLQDAFDTVAKEKKLVSENQKLTFDEWWSRVEYKDLVHYEDAYYIWTQAQENK